MANIFFKPTGSDLTTTNPAVTDTLQWVDRDPANGSTAYSFTVPGLPYQVAGPIPKENTSITATVGGAGRTVVTGDTAGTGEIAVNLQTGIWTFNSADTGGSASVTMTPWATPILAETLAWLQDKDNERVVGPGTVTDNAVPRFNGTSGYILQTSNATINDGGELVLEYDGGNADHEALELYHENGGSQTTVGVGQRIAYYGRNDGGTRTGGSYIEHEWVNTSSPDEEGEFNFGLINGGGIATPFTVGAETVTVNGSTALNIGSGNVTSTSGDITLTSGTFNGDGSGLTSVDAATLDGIDSTGFQPIDSDLTAVAGLATNGIAVRVSAGSWATRTITSGSGTALIVTNGDGTAANPVLTLGSNLTALQSGTIDNVAIGGTTPAAGTFTTIKGDLVDNSGHPAVDVPADITSGTLILGDDANGNGTNFSVNDSNERVQVNAKRVNVGGYNTYGFSITASATLPNDHGGEFVPLSVISGNITLTSTPNIATTGASAGDKITFFNTDSSNTLTFQDSGTLTGSGVSIRDATSKTISPGEAATFVFNGSLWEHVTYV